MFVPLVAVEALFDLPARRPPDDPDYSRRMFSQKHHLMTTASTLFQSVVTLLTTCWLISASGRAAEHLVKPGDSPQAALDAAAPGDRIVFLPGVHEHKLGKHRSILYVDKPIHIELRAGATLKLADGACQRDPKGEISGSGGNLRPPRTFPGVSWTPRKSIRSHEQTVGARA